MRSHLSSVAHTAWEVTFLVWLTQHHRRPLAALTCVLFLQPATSKLLNTEFVIPALQLAPVEP